MTNELCILIYLPLIIMALTLLVSMATQNKAHGFVRQFILFIVMLLGWQICEVLLYVFPTAKSVEHLFTLNLIFVVFAAYFAFRTCFAFYRISISVVPKWLNGLLIAFAVIFSVLAATNPLHHLITAEFAIVSLSPLTIIQNTYGPAFYIMSAYCFGLIICAFIITLVYSKNLPRAYSGGSGFIIAGLAVFFAFVIFKALYFNGYQIDFNLVGASLGCFVFFLASATSGKTDYLHIGLREAYQQLDELVFVLNKDGIIIDANLPAKREFYGLGIDPQDIKFDSLLQMLEQEGKIILKTENGQTDLYTVSAELPLIYSLRHVSVKSEKFASEGEFVVLADVTNNRLFMDRLKDTAGIDELTGLPNRLAYKELLRELDVPENLPLSVIMGDANGLKTINDTYGHSEGDQLLRLTARLLLDCCPKNGHVARIGGDEFVMLLPSCNAAQANEIMSCIQKQMPEQMPKATNPLFRPSIALGSATKTDSDENINALFNEADKNMYEDKH